MFFIEKQMRDSAILSNRKKMWGSKAKLRHFILDEIEVKKMILHFAPGIWDELNGLSDSLKMNMTDTLIKLGGYYI